MKAIIFFIILLFSTFTLLIAQETWFWQNPLPQGNSLYDVHVFNDNSAIAVGNAGTIININSNGQIEQIRHNVNGKYSKFNCLFFLNNDIGWIGGDGCILKTNDGGSNWYETNLDSVNFLWQFNNILFTNDSTGWISGSAGGWGWSSSIILKTTDGGENWKALTTTGGFWYSMISDFHFINTTTGWISSYGEGAGGISPKLWKTTDSGFNWSEISVEWLNPIFFINDTLGFGGRDRQIVKTVDGGYTWQTVVDSIYCKKIFFENEDNGWAIINEDSIISTQDGGYTWQGQNFYGSEKCLLNSFDIRNNIISMAVGNGGHIRTKQPAANDWQPATTTYFYGELVSIKVINENNIWTCGWEYEDYGYDPPQGNRALIHSTDGGNTWEKTVFNDPDFSSFNDIFFLNNELGWAVGENNIIIHTNNGGNTWEYQNSGLGNNDSDLLKVFFTDSLSGYIIGWYNHVLKTVDGGETWFNSVSNLPTSFNGYDIFFINKNCGWIVGQNGYDNAGEIYKTENGGQSWQIKRSKNDFRYTSVQFNDSLVGWVAGDYFNSELIYTENGGQSWQIIFTDSLPISDLFFLDNNYGWIIISNVYWTQNQYISDFHPTYLFYTSNGGQNWEEYFTIPSPSINAITFTDMNTGWVVGSNGAILKTNSGGITAIEDKPEQITISPENFQLSQNYPNPFNPTTTIEFSIPKTEFVKLKIYNLLGQEVAALVSDKLPPGNYKYTWDASAFASGIYYYKIEAEKYTKTRKLILLK